MSNQPLPTASVHCFRGVQELRYLNITALSAFFTCERLNTSRQHTLSYLRTLQARFLVCTCYRQSWQVCILSRQSRIFSVARGRRSATQTYNLSGASGCMRSNAFSLLCPGPCQRVQFCSPVPTSSDTTCTEIPTAFLSFFRL